MFDCSLTHIIIKILPIVTELPYNIGNIDFSNQLFTATVSVATKKKSPCFKASLMSKHQIHDVESKLTRVYALYCSEWANPGHV